MAAARSSLSLLALLSPNLLSIFSSPPPIHTQELREQEKKKQHGQPSLGLASYLRHKVFIHPSSKYAMVKRASLVVRQLKSFIVEFNAL